MQQEMIILQLHTESCHPICRASSAFERGDLGSNGHGKKSTQFSENKGNFELLLRTVISVNQLSIYGATAGTFDTEEGPNAIDTSCREYTLPREQEGSRTKGWIQSNVRFGPVSDTKVCNQHGR